MKVYVVLDSAFDDCTIAGIFSTMEKAEEYMNVVRVYTPDIVGPYEYTSDTPIFTTPEYVLVELSMDTGAEDDVLIRQIIDGLDYPYEWDFINTVGFKVKYDADRNVMLEDARAQWKVWKVTKAV